MLWNTSTFLTPQKPLKGYAHRISTLCVLKRSLPAFSSRIAAFAFPNVHNRPAHSPQTAMRGCSFFAALAADAMKPLRPPRNRAQSATPFTDRRERVGGIQRNIGPWSHRDIYVEALRLQSLV